MEEGALACIAPSAVAPVQLSAAAAGPTAAGQVDDEVRAEAAAALAVLARKNAKIQDKVASVGGIEPLVALLQGDHVSERAKEEVRWFPLMTCLACKCSLQRLDPLVRTPGGRRALVAREAALREPDQGGRGGRHRASRGGDRAQ